MKRKLILLTFLTCLFLFSSIMKATAALPDIAISEIRIDQPGTDNDEFFELAGPAGTSLDGLTYLVIGDGAGGSGVIEAAVDLTGNSIPGSGFFVAAEITFSLGTADLITNLNFENSDNVTHLLVMEFNGAIGDDLDIDDDGVLDSTPWTAIIDSVALIETIGSGERVYSPYTVGPDGAFVPGQAYLCPEGWQIGQFDLGINDTPGSTNDCPISDIQINEIRIDQPGTDNDEFFELAGPAGASLDGLTYLVIGDGIDGSGVIEAVVNLTGNTIPGSGFFVAAESTFSLGTADLISNLNFENSDNVTHLLVTDFSGAYGDDLDIDDDGILDVTPWAEIVDSVALIESIGSGEQVYSPHTVGPDGAFVPGQVYLCPEGWQIGQFDLGMSDTPGAPNICQAANTPPSAEAGGPYTVNEGDNILLDGSGTIDPEQSSDSLTYAWDFDNDGVFDDALGMNPVFPAAGMDGPSTITVNLRVTDEEGLSDTDSATVNINNVSPTANCWPDQTVSRNETVTVMGTWSDPAGSLDEPYTWAWDLDGDGTFNSSGIASFGDTIIKTTSFATTGLYTLNFQVTDKDGGQGSDSLVVEVINQPPDCSNVVPSIDIIWPPNHKFRTVSVLGAVDPDGDPVIITIDSISHNEQENGKGDGNFTPDGRGIGTNTAEIRAERSGTGNGREYHIGFTATDDFGAACSGEVIVIVPKSKGKNKSSD